MKDDEPCTSRGVSTVLEGVTPRPLTKGSMAWRFLPYGNVQVSTVQLDDQDHLEDQVNSVVIRKTDQDAKPVPHAGFTLYGAVDQLLGERYTDETGRADFGVLQPGQYTICETEAPEGYEISEEVYHITVEENGAVTWHIAIDETQGENRNESLSVEAYELQEEKEIAKLTATIRLEGTVTAGDYITVTLDENLAATHVDKVMTDDGLVVAEGVYDEAAHTIRYTFHKLAQVKNLHLFTLNVDVDARNAIDRETVTNLIGNNSFETGVDEIHRSCLKRGMIPAFLNMSSDIIALDTDNGTFTYEINLNPERNDIAVPTTLTISAEDTHALLLEEKTEIRVYRNGMEARLAVDPVFAKDEERHDVVRLDLDDQSLTGEVLQLVISTAYAQQHGDNENKIGLSAKLEAVEPQDHVKTFAVKYEPDETSTREQETMIPVVNFTLENEARPVLEKQFEDESICLKVLYHPEANIPDEAKLVVEKIEEGSENYRTCIAQIGELLGTDEQNPIHKLFLYDIAFVVDDVIVEPQQEVTVQVEWKEAIEELNADTVVIIHHDENGAALLSEQKIVNVVEVPQPETVMGKVEHAFHEAREVAETAENDTKGPKTAFFAALRETLCEDVSPMEKKSSVDEAVTHVVDQDTAQEAIYTKDHHLKLEFKTNSFSPYSFALRAPAPSRAPGTIQTADSRADGITMHLFDFWGNGNGKNLNQGGNVPTETTNYWGTTYNWYVPNDYKIGINKKLNTNDFNRLLFTAYGKTPGGTLNHFTGENAHAREGIVTKRLPGNRYPQLTNNNTLQTNGESLKYLFDLNDIPNAKKVYRNVSHLMTLDDQGTYKFDSNKNYAYYTGSGDNGNFKVYNGTYKTSNNSSYAIGFFPFNDYDDRYKNINNMEDTHYNHHFGMTMSAEFSLPADGKLPNGQDMVFEYSGDDDMWLYIDDVLVLDIGGIHEPVHGTINFATGVVKTWPQNDPGNVRQTSLQALFQAQGITWKNDTSHRFNMFYLERGGQYSNLALTLNIPIVKTVTVNKAVEGTFSEEYMNREFQFLALVDKGDGNYVPYQGNIEKRSMTTYVSDGKFTLKPTESAKLLDMKTSWKYKIVELGLNGSEFGEVEIEGSGAATHILSDGQTGLEASSGIVNTGTDQHNNLVFKNKIREEKGDILVRKIWEGDGGTHPGGIQFKLYRIKNGDTANKVLYKDEQGNSIFTLNSTGDWKKSFSNLIKKSGPDVYTYEVEEVSVPSGYIVSYSDLATSNQTGNFDITNKKRTKVEVEKKWLDSDGTELTTDLPDQATVQLYQYKMAKVAQEIPGTSTDEKVKVVFRSKYYGWNQVQPPNYIYDVGHYADSNTHPYDNGGYLKPDSINEEMVQYVTKGGSITFTIRTRDMDLGVYEVYDRRTNEKLNAANPDDTSIRMEWLGKNKAYNWEGRHPMRVRGTYTLSNLTQNVVYVDVEMIGYLKYGPNSNNEWVPSLRDSFDYLNVQTTEPSGGTTTIYVPPTPPAEMPAIGTAGLSTYGSPVELKAGTGWKTVFDNLPVQSTDGEYYYFYYVKEEPAILGFTATYEGNGSSGGSITVKNTRETIEIPVEKNWSDQSTNSHSGTTVTVKLLKKVGNNWEDTGKTVELNSENGWRNKFEKLPKFDKQGNLIEYKIDELSVEGYISIVTPKQIDNLAGYKITNKLSEIEILKKDADDENKNMQGVKFSLYKEAACQTKVQAYTNADLSGNKVDEFEIGAENKVAIYGLAPGEYWLKETATLDGYELLNKAFQIHLNESGVISLIGEPDEDIAILENGLTLVVKNHLEVTKLKVVKKDEENGGLLKGAKFSLYRDEACQEVVSAFSDEGLQMSATVFETAEADGALTIYGLKPGTYYLKEIKAPGEYILITKPVKLTLDKDGRITLGATYDFVSVQENEDNGTTQLVVTNRKAVYPATGGMGTLVFTLVGGGLMTGALFGNKKQKRRNKC